MFVRFNAYLIPGTLIVLGIAVLIRGLLLPEYSVPNGHDLLFNQSWQEKELNSNDAGQLITQWNSLREKITTHHFVYCDLGYAIISVGVSILAIFVGQQVRTLADLREIRTPKSHRRFYIYAALAWLSFIPAQLFFLNYMDAREDPPFVDSMAIPIESSLTGVFGLVGVPVILFGVWLAIHGKSLPIPIRQRTKSDSMNLVTLVLWLVLIVCVAIGVMCIVTEPPVVPSCVFTAYLLLSGIATSSSQARIHEPRGLEGVRNVGKRNDYRSVATPGED